MRSLNTYVINLDGSAARLEAIGQRLRELDVGFERVSAFDGRQLDLAAVEDYDSKKAEAYMGRSLVGGEIGCYRSHLDVASRFLASDAKYALVLEDDALPLCNIVELLRKAIPDLEAADKDWYLINIGNNNLKIFSPISDYQIDGFHCELVAAHYFPMTTSAIVWSREGASRFVEGHRTIFAPVDNYFRYWLTRVGHGYSFWPTPVTTTDADSLIMSANGRHRKENRRKWFYGLYKQRRLLVDKIIASINKKRFSLQSGK